MTRLGSCGPPRWSCPCLPSMLRRGHRNPDKPPPDCDLVYRAPRSASTPHHSILCTAIVPPLLRRQLQPWSLRQLFLSTRILLAFNLYMFYICAHALLFSCSYSATYCHGASSPYGPSDITPESMRTSYTRQSKRAQNLCKRYESWARQIWSTS